MSWQFSDAKPCECDWFSRATSEPDVPVEFDERMNEYHLVYPCGGGRGRMQMNFCPFCGGAAPKSRREQFFAYLTDAEYQRLTMLTRNLESLADVRDAFGAPQRDLPGGMGVQRPSKDGKPPVAEEFRTLVYTELSDTADVHASERGDGSVHFTYIGKYIGPPQPSGDPPPPDEAA